MNGATAAILAHIVSLGYTVKSFRINGTVELQAIATDGSFQVARCNDGDGDDDEYRAVCLLATAVGVELEDG